MSKRPELDLGAIGDAAANQSVDPGALTEAAGKTHNPVDVMEAGKAGIAKSRIGKKQIQGFFLPEYRKNIKLLSVATDRSVEDLLTEAMDLLFEKHNDTLS